MWITADVFIAREWSVLQRKQSLQLNRTNRIQIYWKESPNGIDIFIIFKTKIECYVFVLKQVIVKVISTPIKSMLVLRNYDNNKTISWLRFFSLINLSPEVFLLLFLFWAIFQINSYENIKVDNMVKSYDLLCTLYRGQPITTDIYSIFIYDPNGLVTFLNTRMKTEIFM